ncbi:MAG: hypothetical protein CMF51_05690 [Legionellales bacterium]|nr:hypothetical protein [Legionellales bacterium]
MAKRGRYGAWRYYGKPKYARADKAELLLREWLDENAGSGIDSLFLRECRRKRDKWVTVPQGGARGFHALAGKVVSGISLETIPFSGTENQVIPSPNFYHQGKEPYCVAFALASAFAHKGLHRQEKLLVAAALDIRLGRGFRSGTNAFENAKEAVVSMGGFQVTKRNEDFNPFSDPRPDVIKLVQVTETNMENSHCIAIVDHMIFDANKKGPMPLTPVNLHRVCLGFPKFLYLRSASTSFIPGKRVQRYMDKRMHMV